MRPIIRWESIPERWGLAIGYVSWSARERFLEASGLVGGECRAVRVLLTPERVTTLESSLLPSLPQG
jgi:hypothetical protein